MCRECVCRSPARPVLLLWSQLLFLLLLLLFTTRYTPMAVAAIITSALLGLLVSLSTFLVIGCTSSLTYNVVGHIKTVLILTGGCMFFGDEMPPKKLLGVCVAMCGIIWWVWPRLEESLAGAGGYQWLGGL